MHRVLGDTVMNPTFPDIRSTLLANGFNPDDPDAVLMAVVADTHLNLNPQILSKWTDHLDDILVAELNGLQPQLTHLVFDGDVVMSNSPGAGLRRNGYDYIAARQEMQLFKQQLGRFRSNLDIVAVPGNHDTDGQELLAGGTPELWLEEIQTPPYQKRVLAGVPVFFLNSGHGGDLDPTQAAWFAAEAALIPSDQEVLVVAHTPSLFYANIQIGLKRKLLAAFGGRAAPVWIIGGHDHSFAETLFLYKGTQFIQMETTTANPIQWGDGNQPGYVVLALQNGRVACRIFRILRAPSFFSPRKPLAQLAPVPIKWAFELIEYPAEVFEEGDYDRFGRVVGFLANDIITHFSYLQYFTVQTDLSRFGGKVRDFLVSAIMAESMISTMSCSFSEVGPNGPWESVPFPTVYPNNVFRITIPSRFWSSPHLYVKLATSLERYSANVYLGGWGLAAEGSALNGYEKWISKQYKTIVQNNLTSPLARPPGGTLTNLEHFAFNIPLSGAISSGPSILSNPAISGSPVYSATFRNLMNFRFARRTAASQPQVSYTVEYSPDLTHWTTVEENRLAITPLDADWEEVRCLFPNLLNNAGYFRTRITSLQGSGGTTHLAAGDLDGDGIDDLLQYAFDLGAPSGGIRPYSAARPAHKAGIPIQSIQPSRVSRIVYPKIRVEAKSGVTIQIQQSVDLTTWTTVPSAMISERILRSDGDWDQVEAVIMDTNAPQAFYRVAVELTESLAL